VVVMTP